MSSQRPLNFLENYKSKIFFIKGLGCNPKRQNFPKRMNACGQIHCLPGQKIKKLIFLLIKKVTIKCTFYGTISQQITL